MGHKIRNQLKKKKLVTLLWVAITKGLLSCFIAGLIPSGSWLSLKAGPALIDGGHRGADAAGGGARDVHGPGLGGHRVGLCLSVRPPAAPDGRTTAPHIAGTPPGLSTAGV